MMMMMMVMMMGMMMMMMMMRIEMVMRNIIIIIMMIKEPQEACHERALHAKKQKQSVSFLTCHLFSHERVTQSRSQSLRYFRPAATVSRYEI